MKTFPPQQLITFLLLLPLSNCNKLNLVHCEKSTNIPNLLHNVNMLVILLTKLAPITSFSQQSYGDGSEAVHGLSWCRAQISSQECSQCLSQASQNILKNCTNSLAARSWFDNFCHIGYDIANFVGHPDTRLVNVAYSNSTVIRPRNEKAFLNAKNHLFEFLQSAKMDENKEFVFAKRRFEEEDSTIFGEAQCTKDVSGEGCRFCLGVQVGDFDRYCRYRLYCELLYGSCYMRYYVRIRYIVV